MEMLVLAGIWWYILALLASSTTHPIDRLAIVVDAFPQIPHSESEISFHKFSSRLYWHFNLPYFRSSFLVENLVFLSLDLASDRICRVDEIHCISGAPTIFHFHHPKLALFEFHRQNTFYWNLHVAAIVRAVC